MSLLALLLRPNDKGNQRALFSLVEGCPKAKWDFLLEPLVDDEQHQVALRVFQHVAASGILHDQVTALLFMLHLRQSESWMEVDKPTSAKLSTMLQGMPLEELSTQFDEENREVDLEDCLFNFIDQKFGPWISPLNEAREQADASTIDLDDVISRLQAKVQEQSREVQASRFPLCFRSPYPRPKMCDLAQRFYTEYIEPRAGDGAVVSNKLDVMVIGEAGTGKSTFLRTFTHLSREEYGARYALAVGTGKLQPTAATKTRYFTPLTFYFNKDGTPIDPTTPAVDVSADVCIEFVDSPGLANDMDRDPIANSASYMAELEGRVKSGACLAGLWLFHGDNTRFAWKTHGQLMSTLYSTLGLRMIYVATRCGDRTIELVNLKAEMERAFATTVKVAFQPNAALSGEESKLVDVDLASSLQLMDEQAKAQIKELQELKRTAATQSELIEATNRADRLRELPCAGFVQIRAFELNGMELDDVRAASCWNYDKVVDAIVQHLLSPASRVEAEIRLGWFERARLAISTGCCIS
jgi:energy-coupling factor transporter ATP-binding protein EcfA2